MHDSDNDKGIICLRCAECCEDGILMNKDFVARFQKKFQTKDGIMESYTNGQVLVRTGNGKCVFLRSDNLCAVYPFRPQICRDFGNPKYLECPVVSPEGKLRSKEEHDRIVAKNKDDSQWSEEFKKKRENEVRKTIHRNFVRFKE